MRRVLGALFPGAIVFMLAVAALVAPGAETVVLDLTDTYGRVVYGAGLALAWVFHRSRVFAVLLCVGLLDVTVAGAADREGFVLALGTVLLALVGGLALTRDRGVSSRGGLLQLLGAILGILAALTLAELELTSFADAVFLPIGAGSGRGIPAVTAFAALFAVLGTSYGFYRWRGPVERALLWFVILLAIAMHPEIGTAGSALFMLAAGLTLTLSVVETSYMLAYRDELTGLPGRRALMQYLDGIKGMYTIAMVDVDHFKQFNDKHGHDVGDQVLQMVAARLGRAPGGAKAYRYGGEEFTLLFPGRTREQTLPHLEIVRESVEEGRFSVRSWKRPINRPEGAPKPKSGKKSRALSVTVSIGMADTAGDDDTPEVVLKRADQALYRAKKKGRNRVSK